jgi:hypothetical protein
MQRPAYRALLHFRTAFLRKMQITELLMEPFPISRSVCVGGPAQRIIKLVSRSVSALMKGS